MSYQTKVDALAGRIFDRLPAEQQTREAFRRCLDTAANQLAACGHSGRH